MLYSIILYSGIILYYFYFNFLLQSDETQQQLFVASFYCYLNYDADKDYVIDLDDIWKWLGFSQKANVKKIIDRTFIIDINYKMMLCQWQKQRLLYLT